MIILSVILIIVWERWGKARVAGDEILVLQQNTEKGTRISEEMLTKHRTGRAVPGCMTPDQIEEILGKETTTYVHGLVPLFPDDFAEEGLTPDAEADRYALTVCDAWLEGFPEGMSRGDRACFYCDGEFVTEAPVISVNEESRSFQIAAGGEQTVTLGRLIARGSRFLVVYYE